MTSSYLDHNKEVAADLRKGGAVPDLEVGPEIGRGRDTMTYRLLGDIASTDVTIPLALKQPIDYMSSLRRIGAYRIAKELPVFEVIVRDEELRSLLPAVMATLKLKNGRSFLLTEDASRGGMIDVRKQALPPDLSSRLHATVTAQGGTLIGDVEHYMTFTAGGQPRILDGIPSPFGERPVGLSDIEHRVAAALGALTIELPADSTLARSLNRLD